MMKNRKIKRASLESSANYFFKITRFNLVRRLLFNGLVGFDCIHLDAVNNSCEMSVPDALFR